MAGQDLSCDGGRWSGGEVVWAAATGRSRETLVMSLQGHGGRDWGNSLGD